jgi:hypothetical protein
MKGGGFLMEVYIILTDTGTIFTKMIKLFTRFPFNHASISFTNNLETTYSFGRKRAKNPFNGGFVKENFHGMLFQKATCAIYKCSISNQQYYEMLHYIHHMEVRKREYKYNFLGLFGILLDKEWNRQNAFFCSEFVATILKNGGIAIKNKPACLVAPKDFSECQDFQLVYEGQLRSYLKNVGNVIEDEIMKKRIPIFRARSISTPY